MTQVDFYILPHSDIEQRHLFACRLTEKAFKLGHRIYIHSDDDAQSNALDKVMWSWRNSSFLPHRIEQASAEGSSHCDIVLGHGNSAGEAADYSDLLINLSGKVPEFFSRFHRVSEIVVQNDWVKSTTRDNFRFYRDRGYPLKTHNIGQ